MKIAKRCIACDGVELGSNSAVLAPFVAYRAFGWRPVHIDSDWGLRDIPSGEAYSLCNSLMCAQCGMLFLDMRFDDDEMKGIYEGYRDETYTNTREKFEPGYSVRNNILLSGSDYIEKIEKFLAPYITKKPRVLDWGGDTGVNTPFKAIATQHDVYDISSRPAVAGARIVERATIQPDAYDLIVFSNVLEHVPNPYQTLNEIVEVMGPQTVLYLEVPHEELVRLTGDRAQRLKQKHHWHEHINFFTPEALNALFNRLDLQTIAQISHPISAAGRESHVFSIAATRKNI